MLTILPGGDFKVDLEDGARLLVEAHADRISARNVGTPNINFGGTDLTSKGNRIELTDPRWSNGINMKTLQVYASNGGHATKLGHGTKVLMEHFPDGLQLSTVSNLNIRTEWLNRIEWVRNAILNVVDSGYVLEWGVPGATKEFIKELKKHPTLKTYCEWTSTHDLREAMDDFENALRELDKFTNKHSLSLHCFTCPMGNIVMLEVVLEWCDSLIREWGYPSVKECIRRIKRKEPQPKEGYKRVRMWSPYQRKKLKTHIAYELDRQLAEIKAKGFQTIETPQRLISVETTLFYDTSTGKFRFNGTESLAVSTKNKTRVRRIAEKCLSFWKKEQPCPQSEIVPDSDKKLPQGVYDDIATIRGVLKSIGVNMPAPTAEGYHPPTEPRNFTMVSNRLD